MRGYRVFRSAAMVVVMTVFIVPITMMAAFADDGKKKWDGELQEDEVQISGESTDSTGAGGPGVGSASSAGRRVLPLCDPSVTMISGVLLAKCATGRSQCFGAFDGRPGIAFVFWPAGESGYLTYIEECWPLGEGEQLGVSAADFAVMKIPPPVAVRQPAKPESLVNVALIMYAEPGVQVFTATVLGQVVSIRATPVAYSWDFRDSDATGSNPAVVNSRSAGRPYPNHTIAHTYTRPGWVSQSLTTTYRGEYAISASPGPADWIPIPGTAQNTVEVPAHEVVETRPQLENPR